MNFSKLKCPFCEIAESQIIAQNTHAIAIRDAYPVTPLHTLILPRRHVHDVFGMGQLEVMACMRLLAKQGVVSGESGVAGLAGCLLAAADPAARSRFTGEILVAASLALIFVWTLAGLVGAMASPWAGGGDAFGRIELWLYAILAGLLFRAPGTWLGFWTINHSGVQTYLIALTAMPFFAIALEAVFAQLGWLTPAALTTHEWLAAGVILTGAVWLIVVRVRTPTPS